MRFKINWLLVILLLAFLVRFIYAFYSPAITNFWDEIIYDELARNLLAGKGFLVSQAYFFTAIPNQPTSFWEPLYPFFVAVIYFIFGASVIWVKIFQALVWVGIASGAYLLAKNLFDEQTGLVAALLVAVYPYYIFFSGLLLTENLYILFLVFFFLFILLSGKSKLSWADFGLGFFAAAAVLTRQTLLYFLPLAFVWLFFNIPNKIEAVKKLAIMVLVAFIIITPWTLRNYYAQKDFVLVSTKGVYNLYFWNFPGGTVEDTAIRQAVLKGTTESERNRILAGNILPTLAKQPVYFIKNSLIKFVYFWNIIPNNPERRSLANCLISFLSLGPLIIFALLGLIVTFRQQKAFNLLILLFMVYYTLVHMITVAGIRMRLPLDSLLIIYAAAYVICLIKKLTCPKSS